MPAGRPTDYSEDMLEKAKEYLGKCHDETQEKGIKVNLPTIEGLARFLGVNKTTLYEWEEKHEEFSNVLDAIRYEQAQRLIDNGLSGAYNPTIAKLLLSSKHGYVEKQETDMTTGGEKITFQWMSSSHTSPEDGQ